MSKIEAYEVAVAMRVAAARATRVRSGRWSPGDVRAKVAQIALVADDDEAAHGLEDDLRHKVLSWIAKYSTDSVAVELATEAIKTSEIEFARWCA